MKIKIKKYLLKLLMLTVLGLIIISFAYVFFVVIYGKFFFKDIELVQIPELSVELKAMPLKEDNAYIPLSKIVDVEGLSDKDNLKLNSLSKDKEISQKAIEQVKSSMFKNTEQIKLFTEAVDKNYYRDINILTVNDINLNNRLINLSNLREISQLSNLNGLLLYREGKEKEAIEEIFKSIKLANTINSSAFSPIEYLFGSAMEIISLNSLKNILEQGDISLEGKKYIYDNLQLYKNSRNDLANVLKYDHKMIRNSLESIPWTLDIEGVDSKPKVGYYFQVNKTLSLMDNIFLTELKKIDTSCNMITNLEITPEISNLRRYMVYLAPNGVGKIIANVSNYNVNPILEKQCKKESLYEEVKGLTS